MEQANYLGPVTQRFTQAVQRKLESYGWTVTVSWGEGYQIGKVHLECTRNGQRYGWGMLLPEIAWREAYKTLVQPLDGEPHWFDLRDQCEAALLSEPEDAAPEHSVEQFDTDQLRITTTTSPEGYQHHLVDKTSGLEVMWESLLEQDKYADIGALDVVLQ